MRGTNKNTESRRAAARRAQESACEIRRESVESTCFTEVGYNGDFRTLEVQFQPRAGKKRGATWRVFGVSSQRYAAFRRAASLGAYFNQRIRRMAGYDAVCVAPAV